MEKMVKIKVYEAGKNMVANEKSKEKLVDGQNEEKFKEVEEESGKNTNEKDSKKENKKIARTISETGMIFIFDRFASY
jgi:hypothetical protein